MMVILESEQLWSRNQLTAAWPASWWATMRFSSEIIENSLLLSLMPIFLGWGAPTQSFRSPFSRLQTWNFIATPEGESSTEEKGQRPTSSTSRASTNTYPHLTSVSEASFSMTWPGGKTPRLTTLNVAKVEEVGSFRKKHVAKISLPRSFSVLLRYFHF